MAASGFFEPLISEDASEEEGSLEFSKNFSRLYTPTGLERPPFHVGTLKTAMKIAFDRSVSEAKLLVIYLHREGLAVTKDFVQIFWAPAVSESILSNCVLWGWDMTLGSNEQTLMRIVSHELGSESAWRLQVVGRAHCPCFVFLSPTFKRFGIELVQFLTVRSNLNVATSLFLFAVRTFTTKIRPELVARDNRNRKIRESAELARGKAKQLANRRSSKVLAAACPKEEIVESGLMRTQSGTDLSTENVQNESGPSAHLEPQPTKEKKIRSSS